MFRQVFPKLEGDIALLLVRLDPSYQHFLTYEGSKPVIYTELSKALYGTLQAALLFWKNLTEHLTAEGFIVNPYDSCHEQNHKRKQCTIVWHVDDLKILHKYADVVTSIINCLNEVYGNEAPYCHSW